ncbi:MAG: alpha-D-ribose 1-methylphosphonate 5-triphosphate diphosphatase [Pseudomonadota bacterium]
MDGLTITDAQVLRPEGWSDAPISFGTQGIRRAGGRSLSLPGIWVLPGIVDAHGDGFERHLAPRRGAVQDKSKGLAAVEVELAAHGITTAYLAQFWSWEGGMRGREFAKELALALKDFETPLDLRLQLRVETHLVDDFAEVRALIESASIDYVVFNDHLPHRELAAGKRPPRLTGQALKAGRSPEVHAELLQELHQNASKVPAAVGALAADLFAMGVRLGSHDDADAAMRADWAALGIGISEFPETLEAAHGQVVMGAPNLVRGGSHKGNVSTQDVIAAGRCDALASDYHYPSLVQGALALVERGVCAFQEAWRLVSAGPADLLGLPDRGTLEDGKRADIVLLNPATGRVEGTFAGGVPVYLSGSVADAFTA